MPATTTKETFPHHSTMSRRSQAPPRPLYKQQSWSPDMLRDEAWQRRKDNHNVSRENWRRHRPSRSLSEDDMEELKACIDLGFGFGSVEIDPKLSDTIPALELYLAVNKQYNHHSISRSSSSSSLVSDSDISSPTTIFDAGNSPLRKFILICFSSLFNHYVITMLVILQI